MLELRTDLTATTGQLTSTETQVSCQVVLRSELLQLPCLDLLERLRAEAEDNPALELQIASPAELAMPVDVLVAMPDFDHRTSGACEGASAYSLDRVAAPYDLRDELHRRLAWTGNDCQTRIASYLIECIDERGYLSTTILDAARELRVDPAEVEMALRTIQTVAPPGVGARDLRECLLLQLAALTDLPPERRARVEAWLRGLEIGQGNAIRAQVAPTASELAEIVSVVRERLTPYPGLQFRPAWHTVSKTGSAAAPPDVLLSREGDGIAVEITTSRMVVARVAEAYRRLDESLRASDLRARDEAAVQAREQVRAARRLIWSLRQRERSLYRVTRAIVACQREFLLRGPRHHRPLTHRRIAELTGLHESTVCRATAGKLVQMPSGECTGFEVFFDDALPARTVLRELVDSEDPQAPLTDAELQGRLEELGFEVARRTVNKYRRALGIPSAAERARSAA